MEAIRILGTDQAIPTYPMEFGEEAHTIPLWQAMGNLWELCESVREPRQVEFHSGQSRTERGASGYRRHEWEWRRTHGQALRAFAGQWVVMEGETIIAHGDDPVQVVTEARTNGIRVPYLFRIENTEEDVIDIGLWPGLTVSYEHQFDYFHDQRGERFPALQIRIATPGNPEQALDIDAYIDSGAERSLLDGSIGRALGLDLFAGRQIPYVSTIGVRMEGWLHRVRLSHPDLGYFELEVGFSTGTIRRNLLGRDFFNLIQIGFRERHLAFYVTPTP